MRRHPRSILIIGFLCLVGSWFGCTQPEEKKPPKTIEETPGVKSSFDTNGDWKSETQFFNFPYPSDLRLTSEGGPDTTGFPNPDDNPLVKNMLTIVSQRKGFPVIPVGYFYFDKAIAKTEPDQPILPAKDAPAFLIDIDPKSPELGTQYPVIVGSLESGVFIKDHLVTLAVYPGIVLHPNRTYAFVIMRNLKDNKGELLGVPKALNALKEGQTPEGKLGDKLKTLYEPLWAAFKKAALPTENIAAATVFTTGAVAAELERISSALLKKYTIEITDFKLDPDDGDHTDYCEILAKIKQPQFQKGTPPFDSDGLFEFDAEKLPIKQRDKELPVVITIPKKPMPTGGYPLMVYVHGSGGLSSQAVDRGYQSVKNGDKAKGGGPSAIVAPFGVGTACTAMPVNPERVPKANDIAYLNISNLKAFRDTFRQGVIEARLFLDALLRVKIPKEALATCQGATLPSGETHFRFSSKRNVLMGQSMGAMYTNLIGAVEPRYKAVIPTGAGGFWSFFALNSNVSLLNDRILATLLGTTEKLTHTHPVLHFLQTAWEPAEPLVYVPHLSRRPFPGHPTRHVYQPIGQDDSYFPEIVLDIMSLAYGNQQAGDNIWPGTQTRLAVMKLQEMAKYPIKNNRKSADGKEYTGVVAQYKADDVSGDGHVIAFQVEAVKYQYSCFLSTFLKTGVPVVPAPAKMGTPCP